MQLIICDKGNSNGRNPIIQSETTILIPAKTQTDYPKNFSKKIMSRFLPLLRF